MNKTIVLFDMDGTLTEPRCKFDRNLLESTLTSLTAIPDVEIGIITGSDEDYLNQQMEEFLINSPSRSLCHLLPCNGTKYYKPPQAFREEFELVHDVSMQKHLGCKKYRILIEELIYSQVDMIRSGVPLTGHFINCRGSMINWSPIGRNANDDEREEFIKIDKDENLRDRVINELDAILDLRKVKSDVIIKLGGDTSFDIYPKGWDKTYGLKHFPNWDVWFVGDRCQPSGNDYELYMKCQGQSYVTSGPEHTVEIIKQIRDEIKKRRKK